VATPRVSSALFAGSSAAVPRSTVDVAAMLGRAAAQPAHGPPPGTSSPARTPLILRI
jgi:hypothetical protein